MSALSDFIESGGGVKPLQTIEDATGTVTLDLSSYSGFKILQGNGDLTIDFDKSNPELLAEAELYIEPNLNFDIRFNTLNKGNSVKNTAQKSLISEEFQLTGNISPDLNMLGNTEGYFSPDGLHYFFADSGNNVVKEIRLEISEDISTAFDPGVTFDISGQAQSAISLTFKPDGTKMYVADGNGDVTYQYDLNTPWDISTASYSNKSTTHLTTNIISILFSEDGLKYYETYSDNTRQRPLSTAWDISTAGTSEFDKSVPHRYLVFSGEGKFAHLLDNSYLRTYRLATPYYLSTENSLYAGISKNVQIGRFYRDEKYYLVYSNDSLVEYSNAYVNKIVQYGTEVFLSSEPTTNAV